MADHPSFGANLYDHSSSYNPNAVAYNPDPRHQHSNYAHSTPYMTGNNLNVSAYNSTNSSNAMADGYNSTPPYADYWHQDLHAMANAPTFVPSCQSSSVYNPNMMGITHSFNAPHHGHISSTQNPDTMANYQYHHPSYNVKPSQYVITDSQAIGLPHNAYRKYGLGMMKRRIDNIKFPHRGHLPDFSYLLTRGNVIPRPSSEQEGSKQKDAKQKDAKQKDAKQKDSEQERPVTTSDLMKLSRRDRAEHNYAFRLSNAQQRMKDLEIQIMLLNSCPESLLQLPIELLTKIISYLPLENYLDLMQTSYALRKFMMDHGSAIVNEGIQNRFPAEAAYLKCSPNNGWLAPRHEVILKKEEEYLPGWIYGPQLLAPDGTLRSSMTKPGGPWVLWLIEYSVSIPDPLLPQRDKNRQPFIIDFDRMSEIYQALNWGMGRGTQEKDMALKGRSVKRLRPEMTICGLLAGRDTSPLFISGKRYALWGKIKEGVRWLQVEAVREREKEE